MNLGTIYNRVASLSPYLEIALRQIYWSNVDRLKSVNPNKAKHTHTNKDEANFDHVIDWLKDCGVNKGDLLIVHSSYEGLEGTGLSPEEIIDQLLKLVGPNGTLCMPVIRHYKEEKKAKKEGTPLTDIVCKYDVKRTLVSSGMLPFTLMRRPEAVTSHFPLNPLCAIGPLAEEMMVHNLDGDNPSPHGPNSSWKFCVDHGAKICAIGTSLEHHNTSIHVAEEAYGDWRWSDDEWYDLRTFEIIDENKNSEVVTVKNRKPKWGTRHIAEINLNNAEKKACVVKSSVIDGITVGFAESQRVISFLRTKNKNGYPYYVFPWQK